MKHFKWWIGFLSLCVFALCVALFPLVTIYAIWADNEEFAFRIFLTNLWIGLFSVLVFQFSDA